MVAESVYFYLAICFFKKFIYCFLTNSLFFAVSNALIFYKKMLISLPSFRMDFCSSDQLYTIEFFILFSEVFQCYEKSIKENSDKLFL